MPLADGDTQVTAGIIVAGGVLLVFGAVAWLMRSGKGRGRRGLGRAEHFERLVSCDSVTEARRLASELQAHGIVALANAEELPSRYSYRNIKVSGGYEAFVAVVSPDLGRAREHLRSRRDPSLQPKQGDATEAEIVELLDDEDAAPLVPRNTLLRRVDSWIAKGIVWVVGVAILASLLRALLG